MINVAFKKEELNKNQSRAFSELFTPVKFVWIPASSIVTLAVLPCYRIVAKFAKRFKGCYCSSRHIRTLVRTTTDALFEENGLALFSMSFFMHWCNTEYILPYIFHTLCNDVLTTLGCFENLEEWSLYFTSKTWRVGQDHSGETNVLEENYGYSSQFRPVRGRISWFVVLFFSGSPVNTTKWR